MGKRRFTILLLGTIGFCAATGCGVPRQVELSASSKVTANDGAANDHFGIAVALDGTRAIVGASGDDDRGEQAGAAYVFVRTDGGWEQEAKLLSGDSRLNDQFGVAVGIDGDWAIVGARGNVLGGKQSGGAYIFKRHEIGWLEEQKLFQVGRRKDDHFGSAVWIDGNVAVVGAEGDGTRATLAGAVYLYRYDGVRWELEAHLYADDAAAFDYFGSSVCVDGDRAVVGARGVDGRSKDSGAAYVYTHTDEGWKLEQTLSAKDGCRDGYFGSAVCVDGNRMVVGAYGDDDRGKRSGSVYPFRFDGRQWRAEEKLKAPDGRATDQFGRSTCLDGDRVIVGAYGDEIGGMSKIGSAYLFKRSGSGWTLTAKVVATGGARLDSFGQSVAIKGDDIAIGVHGDGDLGKWSGSAYLFSGR